MSADRFDLTGSVALVTGGSRGIGRGIALGLAEHGADVIIVYRSADAEAQSNADAIRALGRKAWLFKHDLAEVEQTHDLADKCWDAAGRVDILVNNAGLAYLEHFNTITIEKWNHTLAVNVDAVFFLSQRIAERMIAAQIKGRIIIITSVNGMVAEASLAHYDASKGAAELMMQSLAIELGQHGITVNAIAPGIITTEIGEESNVDFDEMTPYYKQHIPLEHEFGVVEDCVGPAVFLASAAGGYITGQHIVVDGGILCEQLPRMQFMPPYRNTITGHSE
ncbi:MAG: gluconate 5-dehydrogenase [Planctomycetaceae bacterium]|nr:gluconate 5-dehydrogenase [Planctomycetaceae bacterium]